MYVNGPLSRLLAMSEVIAQPLDLEFETADFIMLLLVSLQMAQLRSKAYSRELALLEVELTSHKAHD